MKVKFHGTSNDSVASLVGTDRFSRGQLCCQKPKSHLKESCQEITYKL